MRVKTRESRTTATRALVAAGLLFGVVVTASQPTSAGISLPDFTKEFSPDTIGPDGTSTLTFTIDNVGGGSETRDELAFTDTLPTGVDVADAPGITNSCGGTVTAMAGGSSISLAGGGVGVDEVCEISVNVTGELDDGGDASWENTTGTLTSSTGSHGTATDTLDVVKSLPGFGKSFAPSTVEFDERSKLTFTIDNSDNPAKVIELDFTDTLPAGMVIADPALAATDCGTATVPPVLTAVPLTSVVDLFATGTAGFPALAAGATCTVEVDVIGGAVGVLENVSGDLLADGTSAGIATDSLEVTGFTELLELIKEFADDPAPPGGVTTLTFDITNKSRDHSATDIEFSDDLDATLSGLEAIAAPVNECGGMATSSFPTGLFEYEDGTLPPEGTCRIVLDVLVPTDAPNDSYPNSAGPATGDIDGSPESSNTASDLLFVVSYPILTKDMTPDPVGTGDTLTIEFTITNPEDDSEMSDITFADELTGGGGGGGSGFLPFPVPYETMLPIAACGGTLSEVSFGTERSGIELTGGMLEPAGDPGDGDVCTFSIDVTVPAGLAGGTYTNTTEEISATLDDLAGSPTAVGPPASGDVSVLAAPQIAKEFITNPVAPGDTTSLTFTLENLDPDNAAGDIEFSDDLDDALSGLEATAAPTDTCGGTIDSTFPTGLFEYSGGALAADATCEITVTLDVPTGVGGTFLNETSEVTATVGGLTTKAAPATDELVVAGLLVDKVFAPNPVIPGDETTLTFTLDNIGATDATDITFIDDLKDVLSGPPDLSVVLPLPVAPCGSTLTAPSDVITFVGGEVDAGDDCSFDVTVLVPDGAADGTYINATSGISYDAPGMFAGPPAIDQLTIDKTILELTKEFTDDPVAPDSDVTLEFTITNLSTTDTVTDIAFDDDLDATLSGLEATGALLNECGGMAAGFPAGLFEYSGGELAPEETCTIRLTVHVPPAPLPGNVFPNTTSEVTGEVGPLDVRGDPASDDLLVKTAELTKSFDGPTTATGTAVLSFTIENLDSSDTLTGLAFSDDLDDVVSGLEATTLPVEPCGSGSSITGTSFLAVTAGSLDPSDSCTFDVTVTVPESAPDGTFLNTTSVLFASGLGIGDPASALLTIEPPPTFTKAFAPDTIVAGDGSTLTFTIDNGASALAASSLGFTDGLPAGVEVATPPGSTNTCGGTLTATAGSGTITLAGGTLAAGASCTISVDVTATTAGTKDNETGDLTSSSGNSGIAADTLTVTAAPVPTFAKVFAPDSIDVGDDSTLTFTIDNTASLLAASSLAFTDSLPTGTEVAAPPGSSNTCGGTLTAAAGGSTVSLAGGAVAASASCTIAVDVTGTTAGTKDNETDDLTSSLGNSGTATDTLTVTEEPMLSHPPFTTVTGERFADTRDPGGSTFDGLFEGDGRRIAGSTYEVDIAGRGAIPTDAVGVIVNVTAVDPTNPGFVTVHPCEPTPPNASTLNFTTGVDVANEIFAPLSPAGSVCAFTSAEIDLLLDVVGYVLADDTVTLMTPGRFADSREGATTIDGLFAGFGRTAPGSTTTIKVTGRGGVPTGVPAVIANVTVVAPNSDDFVTVHPCLATLPVASSLNHTPGVDRANELVAEVDADGDICVYTNDDVDLIVDVTGYVDPGSDLVSIDNARYVETRDGATTFDGLNEGGGKLAPGSSTLVQIAGRGDVPADAVAAVVNVAAVEPDAPGFFTVDSCTAPTASSLNYTTGVNGANELVVKLDATGELCVFTSASTHLLVDVVAYQMPAP